jgi:iron(III) transport system substrate-binding protein
MSPRKTLLTPPRSHHRKLPWKLGLALCLLAGAAFALSACGASKDSSALTLYNGQHEQTTALLVHDFERQTGIKVQIRSADEATLANQIIQEGSNSPADVFYTENSPALEALGQKGLLAPVREGTLDAVPRKWSAKRGDWVGVSARVSELVYNPSQMKTAEVPSSLLQLATPQFKGKVGFAPSETDFQPLVTSISQLRGKAAAEAWLKGMKENGRVYPDNETVVSQVNNGESAIGPINHYYWYRLRREQGAGGTHSRLHPFAKGDPGDLINVSGAAVLKSSSKQTDAQKLLEYLVSAAGQRTLATSDSYEYPLRPGIAPPPGLPPLSSFGESVLTPAQLGDGHEALELEQNLGLL